MTQDHRPAEAADPAPDNARIGPDQSDRVRESVGHLQVAAQEVIAAIRVMLDAAEEVVSDPSAATSLFTMLGDIARSGRADPRSAAGGRHDGDDDGDDGGVQRIPVT